jgi:hypothetical protein
MIMRLAVIAIAFSLLAAAPPAAAKPRHLSLAITVTEGEHSRDSNSSTTSITLSGKRIRYVKSYVGYRANRRPSVDKNVEAHDQDLDQIQKLLVENDLLRSRSSASPTDQPGRYIDIEATIVSGKTRCTLKLSGMRENAEKETLYAGLRALLSDIEEIVNP